MNDSDVDGQDRPRSALAPGWHADDFLLLGWLLFLPPLGLYGAWQRTEYTDRQKQIFVGVFIVVWLLSAAIGFLALVYLVACPVYAWLFWRKHEYTANTRLGFAVAAGILAVASLAVLGAGGASNRSGTADSSGCTSVLTRGNCTYYRDSDCRVIARQCR